MLEDNVHLYRVIVSGRIVADRLPSRQHAEAALLNIPLNERSQAEIVILSQDGTQLLCG